MIFDNIEFHNVVEMEKGEKGYTLWRIPKVVREDANDGIASNHYGTGIELRFKMVNGSCDIIMRADDISADLTHPTTEGLGEIAENWSRIIMGENFY